MSCLLVSVSAPAFSDPLIARGDRNYPPYEFLDEEGEPTGFNVDLFRAVAAVMGLEAEVSLGEWTEVRRQLEEGEIDLLIGMFYSESRDREVDFSVAHSIVSHSIFVRSDSSIKSEADLEGKEILVQAGDIVHDYLLENHITDHLIPVADQRQALQLLNRGFHDAAYISKLQGLYFLEQLDLKNVRSIEGSLIPRRYCFAVREGNQELIAQLNEGLNILKLDGTYDEIYDRWFGVLEERDALRRVRRILIPAGVAVLAVILLLSGWSWSLRRQVSRRTRHLKEEIDRRRGAEATLIASKRRAEESLREKEVLLAEVHHRVKNTCRSSTVCSSCSGMHRNPPKSTAFSR